MDRNSLLHLHPTLEMVAQELCQKGFPCRADIRSANRRFRGVCPFSQGPLQEDQLYILRPEDAQAFPGDPHTAVSTAEGTGAHLICPGQQEWVLLRQLLELFSRYRQWEMELDEMVYRNAQLHELCEAGARFLDNPICIHDDWFIMLAMSRELPQVMPPDYVMSSSKMFVPQMIVDDFKFDTDYLETYTYRNAQYWRSHAQAPACLYVNLYDGDLYQGRLLVVEHHRPFRPADYMVAEYLTQRISLLLQRRLGQSQSYRSLDDILFDLLQGRKPDRQRKTSCCPC